jgi:hypothetical protein
MKIGFTTCVICLLFAAFTSYAQSSVSSLLKDSQTGEVLDLASVVNITNRAYAITNELGVFKINASVTDTLYVERLGYVPLKLVVAAVKQITLLTADLTTLDVIILTAKKPAELGDNQESSLLMGLSYLGSYGFKVYVKDGGSIEELIVPIKMKVGNARLGTITFQPFSVTNDHELGLPLASPIIITNIEDLRKNIRLNFNDFTVPNGQFYLLVNRFLPENQVDEDATSFSLNPYLKCATNGAEWDYMYKYAGESSWTSSVPFYKITRPKLAVQVLGRVLQ